MARLYATLADLYARFGEAEINEVADTDATHTPAPELIGRALADAGGEIDAALYGRYRLPIARVPVILTRIACELAHEALYNSKVPEVVKDRAKWAREMLRMLANGTLALDLEAAGDDAAGGLVEMVTGRARSPFASPHVKPRRRT
ncbi:MAG: DUF1320 domain-containing protein [Zoogloeaceae bacterium]|jgi:phage gp36-like protein|nr:DUF1320 domain-containing protein [Zoogloeaceae bacterium]